MCSRNKSEIIVTHIHVITVGGPLILACICHINYRYVCGITVVMTILVRQKCLSQSKSPSSENSDKTENNHEVQFFLRKILI